MLAEEITGCGQGEARLPATCPFGQVPAPSCASPWTRRGPLLFSGATCSLLEIWLRSLGMDRLRGVALVMPWADHLVDDALVDRPLVLEDDRGTGFIQPE
jgi:hypothetical protein